MEQKRQIRIGREVFSLVHLVSKDPVREILSCICIDPDGTAIACNGRSLLAIQAHPDAGNPQDGSGARALIPEEVFKVARSNPRRKSWILNTSTISNDEQKASWVSGQMAITIPLPGDRPFPALRNLNPPRKKTKLMASLGVELLREMLTALSEVGAEYVSFYLDPEKETQPCVMRAKTRDDQNVLGIIMGRRDEAPVDSRWEDEHLPPEAPPPPPPPREKDWVCLIPGSTAAKGCGCSCSGKSEPHPEDGMPVYRITVGCPVHDEVKA